ncbi:MAG: hypothetical protein WCJ68_05295 [Chitinophagia bacterium]
MKYPFFLIIFLLFYVQTNGQNQTQIKIHYIAPKKFVTGQSVKLKVQVSHDLKEEKTGSLTLSLINHQTKKSVDGWFLNIFPFQYFTTLLNEKFEAEFPFTIPNDYRESVDLLLVAVVNELKDTIGFTIPIKKANPIAKKS